MRFIVPFLLLAWPAQAQECLSWSQMVEYLNRYGQIQSARGEMDLSWETMTIFANPETDTWSIVLPDQRGCMIIWAQGIGWRWLFRDRSNG